MVKRYIDCSARELAAYHKKELLQSIADSEGRVLAAETIGTVTPMLVNITNAEFVTSLGADIIMLNIFDMDHPVINGLPEVAPEDTIHEVKRLTGNPGVGVDNRAITKALADLNEAVGDRVILTAGKMHASGILSEAGEKILTKEDAETFIEAGADVLLLPAPGTVPGFTMEHAAELIKTAHEKGVLAMTTIGTSQEGADEATIRQIALMCKMAGADIHHIGDSGYMGMALPENITAYSVAIRGKRHTYRRMAMSLVR